MYRDFTFTTLRQPNSRNIIKSLVFRVEKFVSPMVEKILNHSVYKFRGIGMHIP